MNSKIALGLDVGGTNLKCAIIDTNGTIKSLRTSKTEAAKGGKTVLKNIFKIINKTLKEENLKLSDISGIGMGTPGCIINGVIFESPNMPGWAGTKIADEMKKKFATKFVIANDVTLAALAEFKFGAANGTTNMICFTIGTGIGGGIVINHKIYEGSYGMAGELGHIIVEADGRKCGCGALGCMEAYSSTVGMVNITKEYLGKEKWQSSKIYKQINGNLSKITPKIIYDCAKENDLLGLKINDIVCKYLAMGIGSMINAMSPDIVVLGGGVMNAGDIILDGVKKLLPTCTITSTLNNCKVVKATLGADAGVIGCGALVFED